MCVIVNVNYQDSIHLIQFDVFDVVRSGEVERVLELDDCPPNQEPRLPGADGREELMLSCNEPMRLFRCSLIMGCSGGLMQGDRLNSFQVSGLKNSKSYLSPVCLSMKHRPSSGSKAKLVRNVKLT